MSAIWSPSQYLKFEDHRTRPARDLLAAVPNLEVGVAVDIGCGPGNSTQLLKQRFPTAAICGIDSSPEMIASARKRLPEVTFEVADIAKWRCTNQYDLIFANAVLQWLPDHTALLPDLCNRLANGGTLAVQMPDNLEEPSHAAMREAADDPRWRSRLEDAAAERTEIMGAAAYYDILKAKVGHVDIWRTVYNHPLEGIEGIVEWFESTGLKPYLSRLPEGDRQAYLEVYRSIIAKHYPVQSDGKVLLTFPRLFLVGTNS